MRDGRAAGHANGPDRWASAADVLNTYSAADLARVLREYGEERFARRIATAVVRAERAPFTRCPPGRPASPDDSGALRRTGGHPAKRTFQALRIEVNAELAVLERALPAAVDALAVGGRIVTISCHSLEDRLAKRVMSAGASSTTPLGLPVELPKHGPVLRLLTRGSETPDPEEIAENPRAASARLARPSGSGAA